MQSTMLGVWRWIKDELDLFLPTKGSPGWWEEEKFAGRTIEVMLLFSYDIRRCLSNLKSYLFIFAFYVYSLLFGAVPITLLKSIAVTCQIQWTL